MTTPSLLVPHNTTQHSTTMKGLADPHCLTAPLPHCDNWHDLIVFAAEKRNCKTRSCFVSLECMNSLQLTRDNSSGCPHCVGWLAIPLTKKKSPFRSSSCSPAAQNLNAPRLFLCPHVGSCVPHLSLLSCSRPPHHTRSPYHDQRIPWQHTWLFSRLDCRCMDGWPWWMTIILSLSQACLF